jgi:hypothetical protein
MNPLTPSAPVRYTFFPSGDPTRHSPPPAYAARALTVAGDTAVSKPVATSLAYIDSVELELLYTYALNESEDTITRTGVAPVAIGDPIAVNTPVDTFLLNINNVELVVTAYTEFPSGDIEIAEQAHTTLAFGDNGVNTPADLEYIPM